MKKKKVIYFPSADGRTTIHAVYYIPDSPPAAILQISHGMVEFIERYEEFAHFLNTRGILVAGNDHLGHGESILSERDFGYFAAENGNDILIEDLHRLTLMLKEAYPNLPFFLLGHSMGSFYARQYLCLYGKELSGAIIMGTGHQPLPLVYGGLFLTRLLASFKGWRSRSPLIEKVVFDSYNKAFAPARTDKDWLTRDTAMVDAYLADKRCTFTFTLNAYYNMFKGISRLHRQAFLGQMPKELPVLFTAGKQDPVGDFSRGVLKAANTFKKAGMKKVDVKLYEDDRHEILNELDRRQVYSDLARWLEKNCRTI